MGLILRLALAAMAALLPLSARAAYRVAAEPAWVVTDAVPAQAMSSPGTDGTRYLLVSDQVDLSGARPVWYRRISYTVEAERGLAEGGRFSIGYQPEYQAVTLHHVRIWRDGAMNERRDVVRVQDLRRENDLESGILDGKHSLEVTIPDLKVGDRVDYSFSVEGFNPVFGDAYYDRYDAAYGEALGVRRVRVTYPAAQPLHWRVSRPGYRIRSGTLGALRYVDISASHLPRIREEDDAPAGYDPYGKIELSTAGSWADIVRWAVPLYPPAFADRAVAERMARELRLDDTDKLAAMQRAIAFVQGEIRYAALDMGENSHAPNRPEVTLARRYGDCKDKALLLVALLHRAGIRAEPVLVDTKAGKRLAGQLPSATAFDHVVTRAYLGGHEYWIDATRDREAGPLATRPPVPFGVGLPVCDGCKGLVAIPDPMPARPQVQVDERIDLDGGSTGYSASLNVVTDYRGSRARDVRDGFADEGAAEYGRRYLRYMRGYYEGIESRFDPSFEEREQGAVFRTRERYHIDWSAAKGSVFGIVLFQLLDYVPEFDDRRRVAPIAMDSPRFAVQTVHARYTKGWSIAPETEEVSNPWFSFRRTVKVQEGELVVTAEWRRLADEVPASGVDRAGKDLRKVRDLLQFNVDLASRPLLRVLAQPRAWGWPLLALLLAAGGLALAWWQRGRNRLAGMMYRPRATMSQLLEEPPRQGLVWTLVLLMSLAETMVTKVPDHAAQGFALAAGVAFGGTLALVVRLVLYVALFRLALRVLRVRVRFDRLFACTAWGMAPATILFMGLALVAVKGAPSWLDGSPSTEQVAGVLVAGLFMVVGAAWALVSSIAASSVAAGTSVRRVLGAWGLLILVAAVLAGGFIWLARS